MTPPLDYLFLAAHPDDAELWCGGLLLKARRAGYAVGICDCTRGEAATHGSVAEREAETARANAILQPAMRVNLGLPDGGLADDARCRAALVEVIRRHRPKVLVAPLGPCRHPDHEALWHLARAVHFFSGAGGYPSPLPPWRPARVLFHLEYHDRQPSFVVDISAEWPDKLAAIAAYGSQFFVPGQSPAKSTVIGSEAFYERLVARHRHYGALIGTSHGEAYVVEEPVRLDDPLANLAPA